MKQMKHPAQLIEELIEEKKAVYYSCGQGVSSKGKWFCTIWGRPSSTTLATAHGDTMGDAMRNALAKIPGADAAPTVTLPGLPGITTRPTLPGMTR